MGKMIDTLLNTNAETDYPVFYDNFRRTPGSRTIAIVERQAQPSNRNNAATIEQRPIRITRLRRGPRWIPAN
jgi:hypothetical protein